MLTWIYEDLASTFTWNFYKIDNHTEPMQYFSTKLLKQILTSMIN